MDKIEFILSKDSQGNPISLDGMGLSATKSFRTILDALINIVEYEENLNLKIGLRKSSAAECIIGASADLDIVYNKIKDASEGSSKRERVYVNNLNVIRNNLENKEEYSITYIKNNNPTNLKPLFTNKFKTIRLRDETENNFNVQFFEAYLEENGGKKPNFHIVSGGEDFTIQCKNKNEARKVNPFLYQTFHISAWAKAKKDGMEYTFCDLYVGDSQKYYQDFKDFFNNLKGKNGTEPFHLISEKLESFYNEKDYSGAKKFIRVFLNKYSTPTYLRTILLISKGFKDDDYLGDIIKEVQNYLVKQIGNIY